MPRFRLLASASALLAFLPCCVAQINFNAPVTISTGFQRLSGYAAGDFNGDGKTDLAFTDNFDKRVVVYLNNGTGDSVHLSARP
ncbi:FG-GAP repeat domain-containing protein [Terriglobus sp.]|uniref:FG-GAP repeat domain-containing protein n=1 Tax=Terriglobus sp. TaxID=1889013 RepID=UPI003AFF95B8